MKVYDASFLSPFLITAFVSVLNGERKAQLLSMTIFIPTRLPHSLLYTASPHYHTSLDHLTPQDYLTPSSHMSRYTPHHLPITPHHLTITPLTSPSHLITSPSHLITMTSKSHSYQHVVDHMTNK